MRWRQSGNGWWFLLLALSCLGIEEPQREKRGRKKPAMQGRTRSCHVPRTCIQCLPSRFLFIVVYARGADVDSRVGRGLTSSCGLFNILFLCVFLLVEIYTHPAESTLSLLNIRHCLDRSRAGIVFSRVWTVRGQTNWSPKLLLRPLRRRCFEDRNKGCTYADSCC